MQDLRATLRETAPPQPRFTEAQKTVLFGMAAALLVVYGTLAIIVVRYWPAPVPVHAPAPAPVLAAPVEAGKPELRVAREQARAWVAGWQPDAQLVSAVAGWQLAGGDRPAPGQASWSFSYYSPAAGLVQIVTVDRAGARPIRQIPVGKAPAPVTADWSLGDGDLLLTFLSHGGEAFLRRHAHVSLHFRLSAQERDRAVWYLSAIAPEARESHVVAVDALSRQVVPTN
jgi:hypothetical protein